jgi:hypothetical protein
MLNLVFANYGAVTNVKIASLKNCLSNVISPSVLSPEESHVRTPAMTGGLRPSVERTKRRSYFVL